MDKLFTYVSAIHQLASPVAILRQESETESWMDQGFEVAKTATTYCFDNGVVIRQTVERDAFPSELACSECWIVYEVLSQGNLAGKPFPPRQVFENTCRESFWLSYHRA